LSQKPKTGEKFAISAAMKAGFIKRVSLESAAWLRQKTSLFISGQIETLTSLRSPRANRFYALRVVKIICVRFFLAQG